MLPAEGAARPPVCGFEPEAGGFVLGAGPLGAPAGAVAAGGVWPSASDGARARARAIGEVSENRGIKGAFLYVGARGEAARGGKLASA